MKHNYEDCHLEDCANCEIVDLLKRILNQMDNE